MRLLWLLLLLIPIQAQAGTGFFDYWGTESNAFLPPPGASLALKLDGTDSGLTFARASGAVNPETGMWAPENLLTRSNTFSDTGWVKSNSNITANYALSPVGDMTASKLTFTATTNAYLARTSSPVVVNAGETYTHSIWMRSDSGTFRLKLSRTNTLTWTTAAVSDEIILTTNWQKYSITYLTGSGDTLSDFLVGFEGKTPYNLPGAGSILVWGAQVERGTVAGTYLPTTTAAVYERRLVTGKSGQGTLIEEASTNVFLNSSAPVTQSIALTTAGSGKWTCSVVGAGTVTSSAGTATASGYGAATAGSPGTVTVTVNGTVTYTVSGADATTKVQVENLAYPTSNIVTAAASVTRAAEYQASNTAGVISATGSAVGVWYKASVLSTGTKTLWSSYTDANNWTSLEYINGTGFTATKRVAGVTKLATAAVAASTSAFTQAIIGINADKTLSLYVNGVAAGTNTTDTTGTPVVAATMQWGAINNTLQADGTLDNGRTYNGPITAAQAMQWYRSGK